MSHDESSPTNKEGFHPQGMCPRLVEHDSLTIHVYTVITVTATRSPTTVVVAVAVVVARRSCIPTNNKPGSHERRGTQYQKPETTSKPEPSSRDKRR